MVKKEYRLVKAYHPLKFEKDIYVVSFVEKGKSLVDKHTKLFQIRADSRLKAIKIARTKLKTIKM